MRGFNYRRAMAYGWKLPFSSKKWNNMKKCRQIARRSRKLNRRK